MLAIPSAAVVAPPPAPTIPLVAPGLHAIAIDPDQEATALRICVAVRQEPDPVDGHLVPLRDTFDAQIFLGCVVDAAGGLQRWVEIWVQNVNGLAGDPACPRQALTNRVLDERWRRQAKAFAEMKAGTVIRTGWETEYPAPVWIDPARLRAVRPDDSASEGNWRLCVRDDVLAAAGLPAYSDGLHRYLWVPELGEASPFVPVTPDAPAGPRTREAAPGVEGLTPLNPGGGLMMVCGCEGIGLEEHVAMLGGMSIDPAVSGRAATGLPTGVGGGAASLESSLGGDGWLYLGDHGKGGRMVETFHLKLRVLADAVEAVRAEVARGRRPLLNLSSESFRVTLGEPGRGLPLLWTARAALVRPGDAIEMPLPDGAAPHFLPGRPGASTGYQPGPIAHPAHGRGVLRLTKVAQDDEGRVLLEGTFRTHDPLAPTPSALVRLWLNLAGGRVDVFARLGRRTALAAGEHHVVTLAQAAPPDVVARLRAARGMTLADTRFEVLPACSSACDLHALGVLAVRVLLVDRHATLAETLVRVLSLCTQLAAEHDPVVPLAGRIRALFARDPAWLATLGPHRLVYEQVPPAEALDLIPSALWWDALATIVRMFPGAGPDSRCADFGDAAPRAPHAVFAAAADDLRDLLVRTRSLVVMDWKTNREIHAILLARLTGTAD